MLDQRIIYPTENGGVAIVIPTGEISIEEVAAKDVPAGVEYKIVDVSEIPSDRTFRNAWEYQS
jgi:ribosomal protein S12